MLCSFNIGTGDGRPVSSEVMMSVASGTMRILHTFDTSGTVLDARGFASNTYTFSVFDRILHVHKTLYMHFLSDLSGVFP